MQRKKRENTIAAVANLMGKKSRFAYVVAYFQGNTYIAIIRCVQIWTTDCRHTFVNSLCGFSRVLRELAIFEHIPSLAIRKLRVLFV